MLTTVILDNILQLIERRTQYDRLSYSNSWATCFFSFQRYFNYWLEIYQLSITVHFEQMKILSQNSIFLTEFYVFMLLLRYWIEFEKLNLS